MSGRTLLNAGHESAHAVAAMCCGGRARKIWFTERGAWCQTVISRDPWHQAIIDLAGPMNDFYFNGWRHGITTDDRNAANAILSFWLVEDLGRVLDLAEGAAMEIVKRHRLAIDTLAKAFFDSASGELHEDEIERCLRGFKFQPPPEAPTPTSACLREFFIRAGPWLDVVGRIEQRGAQWLAYTMDGRCRGVFADRMSASRAVWG